MARADHVIIGVRKRGESALRFVRWTGADSPEAGSDILIDDDRDGVAMVVISSDRLHCARETLDVSASSMTVVQSTSTLVFDTVESGRYDDSRGRFPRLGARMTTSAGAGTVMAVSFRNQTLDILLHDTGESVTVKLEGIE